MVSEIEKVQLEVAHFGGHFDEEGEAVTMNINERGLCWKHEFINATLYWGKKNWHVSLQCFGHEGFTSWGDHYAAIRYCRTCKVIDCIHLWKKEIELIQRHTKYTATHSIVKWCKICEKRIRTHGWGSYNSSTEAHELIQRVAKELGKHWDGQSGYGSNWFTILPSEASRLLDIDPKEAERYVRETFLAGQCGR